MNTIYSPNTRQLIWKIYIIVLKSGIFHQCSEWGGGENLPSRHIQCLLKSQGPSTNGSVGPRSSDFASMAWHETMEKIRKNTDDNNPWKRYIVPWIRGRGQKMLYTELDLWPFKVRIIYQDWQWLSRILAWGFPNKTYFFYSKQFYTKGPLDMMSVDKILFKTDLTILYWKY